MDIVPMIHDPQGKCSRLAIKGFADRKWVEKKGLWHMTSLLIALDSNEKILIQTRPMEKTYPGCRDIFGGHIVLSDFSLVLDTGKLDLKEIVGQAAVREANEEFRLRDEHTNYPYLLDKCDLHQVKDIGFFSYSEEKANSEEINRERSTLFIIPIPDGCSPCPMDDYEGKFIRLKTKLHHLDDLKEQYDRNKDVPFSIKETKEEQYRENFASWKFADGIGRILDNEENYQIVQQTIREILKKPTSFKPSRIYTS